MDFCRKTLKLIFTKEELRTHILPPKRDHLKRPALDEQRFNIFLGEIIAYLHEYHLMPLLEMQFLETIRIKFRLDSDMFHQCYNDLIKARMSNFLYEERRRESRRMIRDQERKLLVS